jgi:hypothetical protein
VLSFYTKISGREAAIPILTLSCSLHVWGSTVLTVPLTSPQGWQEPCCTVAPESGVHIATLSADITNHDKLGACWHTAMRDGEFRGREKDELSVAEGVALRHHSQTS